MTESIVEITRREEFCAAHRLHDPDLGPDENRRLYGICNGEHGHNYAVEVTVRGPVHRQTGMVMDLTRLMEILKEEVVSQVDHKNLNKDVPWLCGVIPTAENVALAIWKRLEPHLKGFEGCRLYRVRVFESRNNFVDCLGSTT